MDRNVSLEIMEEKFHSHFVVPTLATVGMLEH
jgi:hypothetical protein